MSQPDNSISVAKVQQKPETTKDKEQKKNCLLSYHSPGHQKAADRKQSPEWSHDRS